MKSSSTPIVSSRPEDQSDNAPKPSRQNIPPEETIVELQKMGFTIPDIVYVQRLPIGGGNPGSARRVV